MADETPPSVTAAYDQLGALTADAVGPAAAVYRRARRERLPRLLAGALTVVYWHHARGWAEWVARDDEEGE